MMRRRLAGFPALLALTLLLVVPCIGMLSSADAVPAVPPGASGTAATVPTGSGQEIPSPQEFFGFRMGADRKLARWDKLVEYYNLLGERSPRMEVVDMGPSTMGNPFLVLFISAPENIARLEELRQINATLSDPRGVSEAEIERAIGEGKAVIVQSMGLHSSEVAASQMTAEVTYDLLTRDDEEVLTILDNTIAIMIPCFNPDGEIMITDWYNEWVGTEYEGASMPWLYHKYIGHDNNRDAFQTNTVESQYGAKLMFRDWVPQAFIDHHQMGGSTARIYVPPYAEPIRPDADPLVWREMAWYGAHISYKEEEAGMSGVVSSAIYAGWGHFGFHWITPFHNIAGMLTESASARLATPVFLHPDQLQGGRRGLPEYEAQVTMPNPWPGGWWRVRDMVDRQKIAVMAALDIAARNRETVLRNAYLKAIRQTQRGAEGTPKAFLIPADQHDALTATKMVNKLLGQGIEVQQATRDFTHEGRIYGAGTYVVSMAQPKRGVIRWLLGQTFYPDNTYTRDRDGNPIRPYDMSTDTMNEFMGVRTDPVDSAVEVDTTVLSGWIEPRGEVDRGRYGYVLDGRLNDSFKAVNLLFAAGVGVGRVDRATASGLRPGDFVVGPDAPGDVVEDIAATTGVDFAALDTDAASRALTPLRIGMYHRYAGGNMDEGWTRLMLEWFEFPYTSVMEGEIRAGDLGAKYDVLIFPDDSAAMITGMGGGGGRGGRGGGGGGTPPEYRHEGIGQQGIEAIRRFVEQGGTVVTLARAGSFAIETFGLPVRNVTEGRDPNEFWSPGSTLKVDVDDTHPLAYGMPERALAAFLGGNQAYAVTGGQTDVDRVVTFIDRDLLRSGWLLGEEVIANRSAVVSVKRGQGRVVLIGFRAQHRMQTHGTFKLVFNNLIEGPEDAGTR